MKLVFDASALLNIVRLLGSEALDYLKGGYILTLTPYEVGNAIWKEAALTKRISVDEALTLLRLLEKAYKAMNTAFPSNTSLVLRLAYELKITYYDSSYVVAAYELGLDLVTDDEKLRRKVKENRDALINILGGEVRLCSTAEAVKRK